MEKMTINMQYEQVQNFLKDNGAPQEMITFIADRMAQVAKKNARRSEKPTAKQAENIELMNQIVATMEDGKRYRVSEINKFDFLKEFSANKVNALVRGLKLDGRVIKETEKNIAYFVKA